MGDGFKRQCGKGVDYGEIGQEGIGLELLFY